MYKKNRERYNRLILSYSDNKMLYKKVKFLLILLIILMVIIILIDRCSENQLEKQKDSLFGKWDEVFLDVDKERLSYFQNNAFIDNFAIQSIQDRITYKDIRIVIGYADNVFFDSGNVKILDGRLPESDMEIAIEEYLLPVLKVKQVGDLIPSNLGIEKLEGLRVCGIVQNYSSRWRIVNWDIPYINCFVTNLNKGSVNIYAQISDMNKNDVEINMLDYRDNISIEHKSLFSLTYKTFLVIGLIIVLLIIKLCRNIYVQKRSLMYFWWKYFDSPKIHLNNNFQLIMNIIITIILYILLSIFLSMLLNNIVFENYVLDNRHLSLILMKDQNTLLINKNSSLFLEKFVNSNNTMNFTILFYLDKYYMFIFNSVNLFVWMFFLNLLVIESIVRNFKIQFKRNPSWELYKYYYGKDYLELWLQKKVIFFYVILEILMYIYSFFVLNVNFQKDIKLIKILAIIFLLNTIRIIFNFNLIKKKVFISI